MLDPQVIVSTAKSSRHFGSEARAATAGGFMAGVPGMDVNADGNAANVVGTVEATGLQMNESLAGVRSALETQLKAHQDKQRARRSFDYQPDMNDLRPTDAQGFPKELAEQFYAPFKK